MTREEAIKDLKELLKWYLEEEPMSETVYKREAVNMAISALYENKSEPIMELKLDKKYIDEAVQKVVEELKENYIWIPKGMTNGEVIKALFPEVKVEIDGFLVRCVFIEHEFTTTEEWWNAPYKKGGEEE